MIVYIAAILGSLRMGRTWSREQVSGQVLMTLLGTFWRRSSWDVFPFCPVNALQWSRSLFSIINTGMGLLDIIRVGRPLPADVQHYLEFSPVFLLWFWKLVLSRSLEKPERKTVCLTPPFMRSAKTHLLTYVRSKRNTQICICSEQNFLHWVQPFHPNWRIFSFSDEGSVKLLLVVVRWASISCQCKKCKRGKQPTASPRDQPRREAQGTHFTRRDICLCLVDFYTLLHSALRNKAEQHLWQWIMAERLATGCILILGGSRTFV